MSDVEIMEPIKQEASYALLLRQTINDVNALKEKVNDLYSSLKEFIEGPANQLNKRIEVIENFMDDERFMQVFAEVQELEVRYKQDALKIIQRAVRHDKNK